MNQLTHTQRQISARFVAFVTLVAMLLSAFPASFFVANAQEDSQPEEKIEICKAANSDENTFQLIEVNKSSILNQAGIGEGGLNVKDIIPGFGDFAGMNLGSLGEDWGDLSGLDLLKKHRCEVPVPDDDEPVDPAPTGEIRVCKLIVDENGDIVDGTGLSSLFELDIDGPDGFEETVEFTTSLTLDVDLVSDNGLDYDAECTLLEDLAPGKYTYADEVITGDDWEAPRYHDYHNDTPDELSDFGEMVAEGGEGVEYQKNFDGSIELEADETRTIAIVNTVKKDEVPELEIPRQCTQVVDEFSVPADNGAGTDSSLSLDAGRDYFAVVSGTYTYRSDNGELADAEYSKDDTESSWVKEFSNTRPDDLDLLIDGSNPDFGAFRADHTYGALFTGTGGASNFAIQDAPYSDNAGSLDVTLYECEPVQKPVCEIGENLLDNGSFEDPVVTSEENWFYTPIVDWVITALGGEEQDGELHRGWNENQAAHGEQYAELDSRESVKMSQTIDTVEGATYELKWAFAPRHNVDADENQLSVQVDGTEVDTEGPASLPAGLAPSDWTKSSYSFVAEGDETTVSFADAGATSDSYGTFLDDAALCFVADPQSEEPDSCSFAGEVIEAEQGLTNGGVAVDTDRSDVSNVEDGVASYNNWGAKEPSWSTDDFYSLGIGGSLEYEFTDKIAIDGPGDDIAIWEITGGTSGQSAEKAEVFFSEDGVNYVSAGIATGDASFDISGTGLDFVKFVRLEDQSSGVQGDDGDGFDVDAITIIDGSCEDYLTVNTTKIVCEDESDLPNYGPGGPKMDAQTALDWVAKDNTCEIVDGWEFEWAPQNTSNPDDQLPNDPFYGSAGGNWTTFTGSTVVPAPAFDGMNNLWVREVLQEGYQPFTYGPSNKTNKDDVSAEFYCHTDVQNFDNFDRIDGPEAGSDYYCVGWNTPQDDPKQVYQCEAGMLFLDTETNDPEYMSLYTVDETDGAATFFADYELNLFPVLAVDEDETVYSITEDGDLVSLDDDGGNYTNIGATGIAEKKPVAMEFAPDGTLYALTQNSDELFEINTFSAAATKLTDLDLDVSGGDVVFEDEDIVYIKTTGEVYAIDDSSYSESLLGTLNVGSKRVTSAATKDGTHYAYTRQDSFHPFTLDPFTEGSVETNTGPFAWGDGSYCPAAAQPEPDPVCELEILSDTGTVIEETNKFAMETFDGNSSWTADIDGESTDPTWIWESYEVADPEATTTRTFVETFEVSGGQNAKLEVAADNSYIAYLNGEIVIDQSNAGNNYASLSQDEVSGAVLNDELNDGTNTLKIVVTNHGRAGDNYTQNPAGVLYRLTLEGDENSCAITTDVTPEDEKYLIDGYKYEVDQRPVRLTRSVESLSLPDTTRSGWEIELYDGDGNLVDATSTDSNGYYYFHVPAGDYEVKEVMQDNWTQIGVQDGEDYIYPDGEAHTCEFTLPMEYDYTSRTSAYEYDGDERASDYRCDFYNAPDSQYRIDGYKYEGSGETAQPYEGWTIYAHSPALDETLTTTTDEDGYYYFDVTDQTYWQVYEATSTDWEQIEARRNSYPTQSQNEEWGEYCSFEGLQASDQYPESDYDFLSEIGNAPIFGAGEGSVLLGNRCDFYNEFVGEDDNDDNGGGGDDDSTTYGQRFSGSSASPDPEPLIAGVATSAPQTCPFLEDHMQVGWENDAWEVTKLQLFLNAFRSVYGGTENPVTGEFGRTTDANVKAFQDYYRTEVLDPWFERGIVPHNRPTGFVYKTTKWKINSIVCPDFADYPNFDGETLDDNVDIDR